MRRQKLRPPSIPRHLVPIIKAMLRRGDKQSDIAACFGTNGGRISEINTGQRYATVHACEPHEALPPSGPYLTPYERWQQKQHKPASLAPIPQQKEHA